MKISMLMKEKMIIRKMMQIQMKMSWMVMKTKEKMMLREKDEDIEGDERERRR